MSHDFKFANLRMNWLWKCDRFHYLSWVQNELIKKCNRFHYVFICVESLFVNLLFSINEWTPSPLTKRGTSPRTFYLIVQFSIDILTYISNLLLAVFHGCWFAFHVRNVWLQFGDVLDMIMSDNVVPRVTRSHPDMRCSRSWAVLNARKGLEFWN